MRKICNNGAAGSHFFPQQCYDQGMRDGDHTKTQGEYDKTHEPDIFPESCFKSCDIIMNGRKNREGNLRDHRRQCGNRNIHLSFFPLREITQLCCRKKTANNEIIYVLEKSF